LIPFEIAISVIAVISILIFSNKPEIILFSIGMVLLSFLYDLYFKGLTKKIVGFKNIYIGLLFSLLPVMAVIYYNASFSLSFFLVITYIFLMIFSGSAFSDIKDTTGDKKEGLKTLAITMGHKNLISFLMFVTLLAMVPIVAGVYINVLPVYALALFFGVAYRVFLFKKSFDKNINKHLLYAVLFDGELTLWVILVILGRTLA